MTSSLKIFLCSCPTECSTCQYTWLHAIEAKKTETMKELIIVGSGGEEEEEEEVVRRLKLGSNASHPIIGGKWDYLEDLNTEEIRNEILKDIKKEATKNEKMIAFWIAVLGN